MRRSLALLLLAPFACSDNPTTMPPPAVSPVSSVPQTDTLTAPGLSAPVDVVRDQWGIPHIYAQTMPDAAYAEGYVMAEDRFVYMDLARRSAEGRLAELLGEVSPSLVDSDIQMRVHHLQATAQQDLDMLKASSDPADQDLLATLTSFANGVNAYVADLQAGKYSLPPALAFVYDPKTIAPWTEVDSLSLGNLEAFQLSFDADSEIVMSQLDAAAKMLFDQSSDPARAARKGIAQDFEILAPLDPTHTIAGWTGMNGDMTTASLAPVSDGNLLALLQADRASVVGVGNDRQVYAERGSNNWVIGPSLSATGHALVANDTHLGLGNPATWYLVHLDIAAGRAPTDVMGVQFAGIPGLILGMNRHVAWGSTVSYIDVTDVYQEQVVACDGSSAPCVMFKGQKVPLTPRTETIGIGRPGKLDRMQTVTLYDVPHHGPILPRVDANHMVEPLGSTELSVRYTGYEPAELLRAIVGVLSSSTMDQARQSLDRDFRYGSQNWVIGDDQGHIGWTETLRVPRRQGCCAPWKVLPGDGSAEWGADMDPKYIPHAYDPAQGYLATANADPIGVSDDGDPFFDEPMVDGSPLYLGWSYDPGTRVGRITKRIEALKGAGKKIALDDMQSIQADAVSEWGQALAPTLVDAGQALVEELAQPGTHPELTTVAQGASADVKRLAPTLVPIVAGWSFDTPSGAAEENPSAAEIADSQATLVWAMWTSQLATRALGDEIGVLGIAPDYVQQLKLLARMCNHPDQLATGSDSSTGDAVLWDDLGTQPVESKRQIAALALLDTIDALVKRLGADATAWRWGQVHTLTLSFPGVSALSVPPPTDKTYPNGFPRHGGNGTVDAAHHGVSTTDFTFADGPAIRFVCDLDPAGPHARNVIPGGETFDPASPHYRDLMELWRKNQTIDLAYTDAEVVQSAMTEYSKNGDGRISFTPATR